MSLESGQELGGRYRLVKRLGSGGMADVWLAEDSLLGRRVALKFLHERFGQDEQFVERFRREAQSAAGLQHPNVVGIYDRGEAGGRHYIAMEYVEGASLKDLIGRGLGTAEAIEIVRQILAGAGYAHEHGIVHRDLKPQNVLVDPAGRARVTDFGIARAGASEITQTGSVLGTAQYLSPEQAQGFEVSGASDLYSTGVILFEALTGRLPFEGESPVSVVLKQVSELAPAPSSVDPRVSPALDAVVLRALAKDPGERFATAAEFSSALDAAEADPQGVALDQATALYGALPAAAAGAALGAGAAAALGSDEAASGEPGEGDEAEKRGGWLSRRRAIALGILALLLAGGAAWALTRPGEVRVPDVTGQPQLEARTALERGGFEVGVDQQAQCADPGIVFEQSPPPGELVDEGSRVNLVVSVGQQVRVPELAGSQLASARMALSKRDLLADATEQRSSRVDEGRVISSAPIAGEQVACKSTVGLAVSSGVRLATVPDLLGSDQGAAESALRRRGFIADVEVTDSDEPEGTVLEQSPPGGAELRRGGRVTITVSSGAGSVIVPDVVGQPEDTAIAILTERGATDIRVVRQISEVQADDGRVTDQAPSAGSRILAGERVTIFVASFQEPPPEQTTTSTTSTTTEPPPATTSTTTTSTTTTSTTTSEPPP